MGGNWIRMGLDHFETSTSAEFHTFVSPLAQAMRLTYTSSLGSSYFNPLDANVSIPGFARSSLAHDPSSGMRALVFVDAVVGRRVLLAFRGTDLDNRTAGGMADACAGRLLFGRGMSREDLPASCESFPDATLDYGRAAIAFAGTVQTAYPGFDLLVTGHSLGAGLALLVARALNVQVVALALPPIQAGIRLRRSAYFMADSNDPVQRAAHAADLGGLTYLCLWDTGATPASCADCRYSSNRDVRSSECLDCIAATHSLKHYLGLLRGPRPLCARAAQPQSRTAPPVAVSVAARDTHSHTHTVSVTDGCQSR